MSAEKIDALIFTDLGAEAIKKLILQPLGVTKTRVRDLSEPLLSLQICFYLLVNLRFLFGASFLTLFKRRLRVIYEKAIIDYWNPRLVITFRDNEPKFYELAKLDDKRLYFAIQNSVRFDFDLEAVGKSLFNFEPRHPVTYYSWGTIDNQLHAEHFDFKCDVVPVGSFRTDQKNRIGKIEFLGDREFDICLVSTVGAMSETDLDRPRLLYPDAVVPGEYDEMNGVIARHLKRYVEEHAIGVIVALRGDSQFEKDFFRKHIGNSAVLLERKPPKERKAFNFNTYHAMDRSSVVLSLASSAMFEAMAEGKKILQIDYSKAGQYFLLQEEGVWQVSNRSYEEFKRSLDTVINMQELEYKTKIKKFANSICVFDAEHSMTQKVRDSMKKILSEHLEV